MRGHNITVTEGMTLGALLIITALAWGCEQEDSQASSAVKREDVSPAKANRKAMAKANNKPAEAKVKEKWHYDPTDKWDPFNVPPPPVLTGLEGEIYDLDQMILKGVIRGSGMDGAYIRLPDGTDRIIRIGDMLGKHGGEVKEIGKDYVIVEERYMDPEHPNDTFIIEKVLKIVDKKRRR